ncbi:MAG: hypothetical protein HY012_03865 [Acidobacteria bacterium]|nr:hypothetical protein [Acidobacteriota bacterium]
MPTWAQFMDALWQGLPLIKPQLQLTLWGIGILLTDFFLEQRHKYWNAIVALIGVAFSGVELWRLRGVEATGFNGSILW